MTVNGKNYTIQDMMRPPVFFSPDDTLRDVLAKMIASKTNSGLIVDAENTILGMVSTVDVIKAVLPEYIEDDSIAARFASEEFFEEEALVAANMPVQEFMNKDVPTVKTTDTVLEAAVMAIRSGLGRIVVVDESKKPIGVLTRTEIKLVIGTYLNIPDCLSS